MKTNARTAATGLAVVFGLTLTACAERSEPTAPTRTDNVRVTLDRSPNASQACFFQAAVAGDFSAAGLSVSLVSPTAPGKALDDLTGGRSLFALSSQPQLAISRGAGAALVSIATVVREPLWRVNPPRAVAKPKARAPKPKAPAHQWTADGLPAGIPSPPPYPGMLVVARREDLGPKGSIARRFAQALGRGCAQVGSNGSAAVTAIAAAPGGQKAASAGAELARYQPQFKPPPGRPWGWQDPAAWSLSANWLAARRLVGANADPDPGFTNEFLAGQGV